MLRAAGSGSAARLLGASAASNMSVTGTVNETALATISIPAGAMGLNGAIEVRATWTCTNSVNNKTMRVRLAGIAGTQYFSTVLTTSSTLVLLRQTIRNRGATNSQVSALPAAGSLGASAGALVTSAVDTTAAVDLVISGQLVNTGETIALENYEVWLLP